MNFLVFGLVTHSDLPLLTSVSATRLPDVSIQIGAVSLMPLNRDRFAFAIPHVATFCIEKGSSITYAPAPGVSEDELRLFILGSCFGALLQQRGMLVLHGNALSLDSGKSAHIFAGHQGAGKSTTAAFYYEKGAHILADDVCAIFFDQRGQAYVMPSYPQIKLWKVSADLLNISTQGLRRVRPQDEKFALPLLQQFWPSPLPIRKINEITIDATNSAPLKGAQKLHALVTHSYRFSFLEAMGRTAEYMKQLMRLAEQVSVERSPRVIIT